ncbi:unnamed protein product [Bursaphelenchus xylophilus]|uniref:(pine wood nematode) hypothetical protein n=1 Tax=Bursaphelenchus xylophilus TaxID=6326 RepID=A0A1I7SA63_BURXY|nr:unnamed protein product [Bursaphelenchus xylophilus]CAG9131849.1 unnamed protein product [Bursaphelenchus xylophilus]
MSVHFFGESHRTFFGHLHIVNGGKFAVLAELLVLAVETYVFSTFIGFIDAFGVCQVSWSLFSCASCWIGFWRRKYHFFWPLIVLKIVECVCCLLWITFILCAMFLGRFGLSALKFVIFWKFIRVEPSQLISFVLFFFVVTILLLIANVAILDVIYRVQRYYRYRAMAIYQLERQEIMRNILSKDMFSMAI